MTFGFCKAKIAIDREISDYRINWDDGDPERGLCRALLKNLRDPEISLFQREHFEKDQW